MDVFTHGLWGGAVVYKKYRTNRAQRYMAALFGVLPDIIPFAPAFFYMLFSNITFDPGLYFPAPEHWVFSFAVHAYNFTHSLVLFGVVVLATTLVRKGKLYLPLLAWGLHILMDIPTHPDFFQTPFLFPLSDFRVSWGVSWANPWIFGLNWVAMLAVYFFILRDISRRQGFKTLTFLNTKTLPGSIQ